MIRFSRSEDYAVILVNELVSRFEQRLVSLSEVARKHNLSILFLRNIAQDLRRASIIEAMEGKNGGYKLVRHPSKIQLGNIIEAVVKRPLFSCCQDTRDGKCHANKCSHGFSLRRLSNEFLEKIYHLNLSQLYEKK